MAKMIVVNSSPIIALGKIEKIELLRKLFGSVIMSEQVYKEIISKPSSAEAIAVKKAVDDRWLKLHKTSRIKGVMGIGEASSLSLASQLKQPLIVDDRKAVFIANTMGIECHGTLYVVLLALKRGVIKNKREAIDILNQLISNNFYLRSDILSEFYTLLNNIDNLRKDKEN